MNKNILKKLASDWVVMAQEDIKGKIMSLLRETSATVSDLAECLDVQEVELHRIISNRGVADLSLNTFAKLLIASGNVLEIRPVTEIPPCCHGMQQMNDIPQAPQSDEPHRRNMGGMRTDVPPMRSQHGIDDIIDEEFEAMFGRRRQETPHPREQMRAPVERERREENPTPQPQQERRQPENPFEAKSRAELVDIVRQHLWDTEIDCANAHKNELVAFLSEKDRRIKEYKRIKELENDPKVTEFKNRLKKTFDENPHLRDWAKGVLENLGE